MKIAVFGLGYVGVVNVACLSKIEHVVYCTDVKKQKVQLVLEGKSPILEPEVEDLIKAGVADKRIIPSNDVKTIVADSEVIIVCVGTPSKADGEVNLDYLRNALLEITTCLNANDEKFIVFRSTVPPGTTEGLIEQFVKDKLPKVKVAFYPEFLREGTAVKDFTNYGRFVLGTNKNENVDALIKLLHVNENSPKFITDYKTAEYAKYVDNSFHALKVSFANEIFGLGAELGINVTEAHKIFIADDKLNISHRYLRPGTPYGGSCLPKDVREIQHLKLKSERQFNLLENIIPSNQSFLKHLYKTITNFKVKKIAFVGITFKNNSDDLRESPMLILYQQLKQSEVGYELLVYDEDLNIDNVRIEFPNLFISIKPINELMENAELVVVTKRYLEQVIQLKNNKQIVLNLSDTSLSDKGKNIYSIYEKGL